MNTKIISAGAGSGKTYRLTEEMVNLISAADGENVRPKGILATTFTKKAAAELYSRVRTRLLEAGLFAEANDLSGALIGTVHGVGVKLLRRFAFEAGVSPEVEVIAEEDEQFLFNQSLAAILSIDIIERAEELAERLGFNKDDGFDWRKLILQITQLVRVNKLSIENLEESKEKSIQTLLAFIQEPSGESSEWNEKLIDLINQTLHAVEAGVDSTKKTQSEVDLLKSFKLSLLTRAQLNWHEWARISKMNPGVKSRDDFADLIAFATDHVKNPLFHSDIREFTELIFDCSISAIEEYHLYKTKRGLIDYTDMEVNLLKMLEHPEVREVLKKELDLVMVDEFQDTSPIQLEIFLKLTRLAKYSVWVGDPKQSIYGFRGAEPALMNAAINHMGGIRPENILKYSWRSRADLVNAVNAIFTKSFDDIPENQIALSPKRKKESESIELDLALIHWHFLMDGNESRAGDINWFQNCVATQVKRILESSKVIICPQTKLPRKLLPGDIALLCRSNKECRDLAESFHKVGIQAAVSRTGLLATPEGTLLIAALKYLMNPGDSLSVAEILLLAENQGIESILNDRLAFIDKMKNGQSSIEWGSQNDLLIRLNEIRSRSGEMSGLETLDLLLEELDIRRLISQWGNATQRLDNVDAIRQLALKYEEACNRLNTAASLGGLLLWFQDQVEQKTDEQGSGKGSEAVNILTYHKSKGLEWPFVVCMSLENTLRDQVWGVSVIRDEPEFDLNEPLKGRWIRYWLNPYSSQYRGTLLFEKLESSIHKMEARKTAIAEEARLLYVGFTRARDYLALPTRMRSPQWLSRVCSNGEDDGMTLAAGAENSPWIWKENALPIDSCSVVYEKEFGYIEKSFTAQPFLSPSAGSQELPAFVADEEDLKRVFGNKIPFQVHKEWVYGKPIQTSDDSDEELLCKVLEGFFFMDLQIPETQDREVLLAERLQKSGLSEKDQSKQILDASQAFCHLIHTQFHPDKVYTNYPVSGLLNNQLFRFTIDMLIIGKKGNKVLLSDISSGSKVNNLVKQYAPTLHSLDYFLGEGYEYFLLLPLAGKLYSLEQISKSGQLSLKMQ